MKVLYFANVAAEYRIPFFQELEKKIDIKFVITKQSINKKIYDFGINLGNLKKIIFLSENIFKHFTELIKILISDEYDLCVIPPLDSFGEMLDVFVIVLISSIKRKKKVLFWEKWQPKEEYIPQNKKIKNKLQKYAFNVVSRWIDLVLVPGEKSKKYFEEYLEFPTEKIKTVINTSKISCFNSNLNIRKKYDINDNTCIILYFGRVMKVKGLDILIKAISKINKDDIQLIVCGDGGFLEHNKRISKDLNVKCIFTGKIRSEEREAYFKAADIFVLPSRIYNGGIEAWGLTVSEAMNLEVPCIVSDAVGCSYDLIKDNKNGLIFKNESVDSLVEKILILKNDTEFKYKIIKNAKLTVENVYNYDNMAKSFVKNFEILNEK